MFRSALTVSLALTLSARALPQDEWRAGVLFDEVSGALERSFYDKDFRVRELPELIERYRPDAEGAVSLTDERAVIHGFLSEIPASHLALYSKHTFDRLWRGLTNRAEPRFGLQVVQLGGRFFVHDLLAGGPAERAGLEVGDRIVRIDDAEPGGNARLDWRSDDAYLDDPPLHDVFCDGADDVIEVAYQRTRGGPTETVAIDAAVFSVFDAAEASVRVLERDGARVGYLRLWLVHVKDCHSLIRDAIEHDFADCDGVIIDLRGRGGSGAMVSLIERELARAKEHGVALAALIDGRSRSAKEVLAARIKERKLAVLVGETTEGAVLPASFAQDLSYGAVLMFPTFKIGPSDTLEGHGVEPDIAAPAPGPYAAGRDPILEAGLRALTERPRAGAARRSRAGSR